MWRVFFVFGCMALYLLGSPGFGADGKVVLTAEFGHDLFALSPDGKHLALYGFGEFKIAESATGKVLRTDQRNTPHIYQMYWLSDGKRILTVGEAIQFRDAQTLNVQQTIAVPEDVWRSAVSPDEKLLAAGQPNGEVLIVDLATRKVLTTLKGHKTKPNCLVWNEDGSRLYTAGGFGDVEIISWDVQRSQKLSAFSVARYEVNSFALSPDEKQIVVLSDRENLTVRSLPGGREVRKLDGMKSAFQVVISPDGKTIVSSSDNDLMFWDRLGQLQERRQGHDGRPDQIAYASDGTLVSGGGRSVVVWKTKGGDAPPFATSGDEQHSLATDGAPVQEVSLSPNGRWLAAAVDTEPVSQVYVWHADTLQLYAKLPTGSGPLLDAHFRDDNKLVYQNSQGEIVVWEAGRKKEMRRLRVEDVDHEFGFSRGRNVKLAIGSGRGEILIAGAVNGETLLRFPAHTAAITSVDITANGRQVVSGSHDETAAIWDAATGQKIDSLPRLPGLRMTYHTVRFSPDDNLVAAGNDGAVILWDVKKRKLLHQLSGHDGYCRCLAFSTDSKWLVTGGDDRLLRIWNVASGKEVARLAGHTDMVTGVCFSADGRTLASCSFDKTVKLWDVAKHLTADDAR